MRLPCELPSIHTMSQQRIHTGSANSDVQDMRRMDSVVVGTTTVTCSTSSSSRSIEQNVKPTKIVHPIG